MRGEKQKKSGRQLRSADALVAPPIINLWCSIGVSPAVRRRGTLTETDLENAPDLIAKLECAPFDWRAGG
jgi:hypothetical protein